MDDKNRPRTPQDIEKEIADLEASWPPHTVRPWMLQKLEELEEELEKTKRER